VYFVRLGGTSQTRWYTTQSDWAVCKLDWAVCKLDWAVNKSKYQRRARGGGGRGGMRPPALVRLCRDFTLYFFITVYIRIIMTVVMAIGVVRP
jgi:hypothetical protein